MNLRSVVGGARGRSGRTGSGGTQGRGEWGWEFSEMGIVGLGKF